MQYSRADTGIDQGGTWMQTFLSVGYIPPPLILSCQLMIQFTHLYLPCIHLNTICIACPEYCGFVTLFN